jgi:hypothetical protein
MKLRKTAIWAASLLLYTSTQVTVLAAQVDTVLIIDITGGMVDEINVLTASGTLDSYDNALTGYGHNTRYGLVAFDGTASLTQDMVDFATFTSAGGAFKTLSTGAGTLENGALAISTAANASLTQGAYVNLLLLTDEPGSWSAAEESTAIADGLARNATLEVGFTGVGSSGNYLALASGLGSFDASSNPTVYTLNAGLIPVYFGTIFPDALQGRIQSGAASPNPVPLPGAVWLLLPALLCLLRRHPKTKIAL